MKPETRSENVVDRLHGVEIRDPFRWLESEESPEVRAWVEAQNAATRRVLDAVPSRARIRSRLEELLAIGSLGSPLARKGRLFHTRREGLANQPILHLREGASGEDRVLLDPNSLSEEGTVALDWWYPSWDGRLLAYGLSSGGSELSTLQILDVQTGRDLEDRIPFTRACSVAWEPDGRGFYYTRYPEPGTVPPGQEMYGRRVFHHRLGRDPREDPLVFGEGREPEAWPNVVISPDGRWLAVVEAHGWVRTQVYLRDLAGGDSFTPLVEGVDALYGLVPLNDRLLVHTNEGASTWRLHLADPLRPGRENWRELIPPERDVLQGVEVAGGKIVAAYLRDAASRLRIFSMDGTPVNEIDLPTPGSVSGLSGEIESDDLYFGFASFTVPPRVYRHQMSSGRTVLWGSVEAPLETDLYETTQRRFSSSDGTIVPMFLIHRKGIPLDGTHPVLLSGYGGFNISMTPAFDRGGFVWLEAGGILAVANLRGGSEYGEDWHRAGMLSNKQNVFDDFIAAAAHLIGEGYTSPSRLAISGGSNGGLLVGAALTQRPDLYRAVVCSVPLLDMLRYHHFRIARLWIPEYGSPEVEEQFRWLHAYSPYHRVQDGSRYPSVLLMTAESDSRVDPMHARKMAARLQAAQAADDRPILLRVETRAGHGVGKPLSKQIEEQTDRWSFLFRELGLEA